MIKQNSRGTLIVISAPSGSGKGSVIEGLLKNDSKNRWLSVSTTSRPIRENDIPGKTYNFVTKEEFEKKIEEGYFLEYTKYAGNYYGTPKEFIGDKEPTDDVPIYMLFLEKSALWDLLISAYKKSNLREEAVLAIGEAIFKYLDNEEIHNRR